MPAKMSEISPTTTVPVAEVSIAVRTLRLSCRKAGKAPIFTPVRELSGESRIKPLGLSLHRTSDHPQIKLEQAGDGQLDRQGRIPER